MRYTVVQILGTGYSGSSILNLILDSLQGVRGLGEIARVYTRNPVRPCSLCQRSDQDHQIDCHFYDAIPLHLFYSGCFLQYPDTHVLIDSSKSGAHYPQQERWLEYQSIWVLKYPHEYAGATAFQNTRLTVRKRFENWIHHQEAAIQMGRGSLVVPYRSFAENPDAVVQTICDFLGIKNIRKADWWHTDTHIIGGNTSARAQVNVHYQSYLQTAEKYQGAVHKIFVDQHWRTNQILCEKSLRAYRKFQPRLDAILTRLQLPSVADMIADIRGDRLLAPAPCSILES
ncbi:MAG: hypothetical protein LC104_22110 [Bacteroidales bacterium]|nr:hypothetical protein [Bacteroidales bacterium]